MRNYNKGLSRRRVGLLPVNTELVACRYKVEFLVSCVRKSVCFGVREPKRGLSQTEARFGLISSVRRG